MEQLSTGLSTSRKRTRIELGRLLAVGLILLCFTSFALSEEQFKLGPPDQEDPIIVQVFFELHNINEIIDELDTFEFTGVLTLKWLDPREAFDPAKVGVNEKVFQGDYQFNEIATGWYPQFILVNEAGLFEISGVTLRIGPDGSSTLMQSINATSEVNLNLRKFPFDKQRLEAVFQALGYNSDEVLLQVEPDISPTNMQFHVPQWDVLEVSSSVIERPTSYLGKGAVSSAFILEIDVERKPLYIIRLVVVPLIVIVLLSFTVFWMDKSSLGDRLNVSFIGILTGVAYILVTSDHLPNISYFTLINGFLKVSFLTMCATVVINLVVSSLDKQGKSEAGDRVDRICRWAFPLVYFSFSILMFLIAILDY